MISLSKDILGCCINIDGKCVIDRDRNLNVNDSLVQGNLSVNQNVVISGDLEINGQTTFNGSALTSTVETAVNSAVETAVNSAVETAVNSAITTSDTIDNTNTVIKVFEGTAVNVGDIIEHVLYNQPNHARSILELKVFVHDVNSNTFWRYSDGKYMWYREWTNSAQELVIGTPVNIGSGDPLHFLIERYQTDNNIHIKITQNTPIDTNTKYKIIAKIIWL